MTAFGIDTGTKRTKNVNSGTLVIIPRSSQQGQGWDVTRRGDVLHEGADQGLPAGPAQSLGSLLVRQESISKILLMAQNLVQSANKE